MLHFITNKIIIKKYDTFLFYLIDSTRRKKSTVETALFIQFYVLLVFYLVRLVQ